MENKIIEKIEKLLRLSGSSNEHEAESALKFAQELAIKYDIDISRIAKDASKTKQDFVKEVSEEGQRFKVAQKYVNSILIRYFGVSIVTSGGREMGRRLYFIGRKDKAEFAKMLNGYLNNTFLHLWHVYQNRTNAPTKLRETYFYGLQQGLMQKLEENKKQVEKENVTDANQYALVMVDEKKQLALAEQSFFSKLRKNQTKFNIRGGNDTIQDGIRAGRQINIHAGQLT